MDQQLDAAARVSDRFAELQLDLVDYDGNRIGRYGGVWDRNRGEYVEGMDARHSRVIRMHPGQVEAAEFLDAWLADHIGIEKMEGDPIFDALLAGGRRGGKTVFAMVAAVIYALVVPGAMVVVVVPGGVDYYDEPVGYLEALMPGAWYQSVGLPHWAFYLINGSRIVLRSGFTARKMKLGRADFVVVNEGQQVQEQAYTTISGGIADVGGLVLVAANPPDVGDRGTWVGTVARNCLNKVAKHSKYFFFDPLKNPEISHAALMALREKMDQHTFDVQVRGMFLLPPDAVLHAWSQVANERAEPDLADCTREFTKHFEGRAYSAIWGIDVQNFPWIAAIRIKAYRNPDAPGDMTKAILWAVGEVFEDQGDEVDVALAIKDVDDPETTLLVTDASCEWQQMNRDEPSQRPDYRGRGSADMFRGEGFRYVVTPDRYMKANPDIIERCRAANAKICNAAGQVGFYADPHKAEKTCQSVALWRTNKTTGKPSRSSHAAHGGDALTYVIWRFFPRRKRGSVAVTRVNTRSASR